MATFALADRTRHVALTATLIAGVTVAGVSAATPASQAHPLQPRATTTSGVPAAQPPAAPALTTDVPSAAEALTTGASPAAPALTTGASPAAGAVTTDVDEAPPGGTLAWKTVTHKAKPTPTATAAVGDWVNPLPEAEVTSCFGERWGRLHAGVDLAAAYGTPIRAAGAGTVIAAGPAEGYGNAVLIDHHNGYLTHYGHMSVITVEVGQTVAPGEQIGAEGSTGHSTGPHLHFEVHKGTYKNPIEPTGWLHEHGVDIPGCTPLNTPATQPTPQD